MMTESNDKRFAGKIRVANGKCPAGHSLMNDEKLMDGERAITVKVRNNGKTGLLHLNPFYGRFEYESDVELNQGDVIEVFCPHCGVSLLVDEKCVLCDVSMFAIHLPDGGEVEACPVVGCQKHSLKIVDFDEQLARMFVDENKFQM